MSLDTKVKELTEEELRQLELQDKRGVVSKFHQEKLEKEAGKNWDKFYKRNENRFFKDRHWTTREFEELISTDSNHCSTLLEVGCGVGNFFYPLLEVGLKLKVHACDISERAIDLVKKHHLYNSELVHTFVCDITKEELSIPDESVDLISLIFVLSAILPCHYDNVVKKFFRVLRPGGFVLLRDYAINDMAMIRFGPGNKLAERLYARQDGTRSYYFTLGELDTWFKSCGFQVKENSYVKRETVNKKEAISAQRIFVQAKFQKPAS